jgi:hypothetical protein
VLFTGDSSDGWSVNSFHASPVPPKYTTCVIKILFLEIVVVIKEKKICETGR